MVNKYEKKISGVSLHVLFVYTPMNVLFAHAASFFNASLKNSGKLCLKGGVSLHVLFVYTPMNVSVCTCCEFFLTLSLKNSGILCLKRRSVPLLSALLL